MPNVYNKTTGELISCDKEQVEALTKGNYSLTKPDLDEDQKEAVEEAKAEEAKVNAAKEAADKKVKEEEAQKKQIQKDQRKVPGKK